MSSEQNEKVVHIPSDKDIVMFDGFCNLCNSSVQFILNRDPEEKFVFAALTWPVAQTILKQNPGFENVDSILLFQNSRLYHKSSAALRIAGKLKGFWPLLKIFLLVPKPVRDIIYDWIAKNRYRWFGKKESCMIPDRDLSHRFLTE
jgi:predicted DCC family thiol-disulfide oxidoreductase YuxK